MIRPKPRTSLVAINVCAMTGVVIAIAGFIVLASRAVAARDEAVWEWVVAFGGVEAALAVVWGAIVGRGKRD